MPAEDGYKVAIVIIDRHEPEGETGRRLLEIAAEKGYSPRVVEAQRGEHDAGLSYRVPEDVAEAFNGERADLWPDDSAKNREVNLQRVDVTTGEEPTGKIENVTGKGPDQGADADQNTTPTRARTSKKE